MMALAKILEDPLLNVKWASLQPSPAIYRPDNFNAHYIKEMIICFPFKYFMPLTSKSFEGTYLATKYKLSWCLSSWVFAWSELSYFSG